jgi:nucleoside-diphosphate-sugar epimerase
MVTRLVADGHSVLAVSHHAPTDPIRRAAWDSAHGREIVDIRNDHLPLHGVQEVYNFAADMGGVGYFNAHDFWPYLNNSRITFNVLESCVRTGVGRVFMASSACAYPTEGQMTQGVAPLLSEAMLEHGEPDLMYGREKLMVARLAERAPLDARVGILHTVYGIGQECEGERMKFPTAIATKMLKARTTGTVEIWGNGEQLRSYLWIDDAVDKISALMADPINPGPMNIGRQGAISVRDVALLCADHLGIAPELHYTDDMPSGVLSRDCDNERFWGRYGRMEPTGYPEGFARLIDWLEAA